MEQTKQIGTKYSLLAEKNKKYMNNIAFTFGNRKITYEEFHDRVWQYTKALYKKGIRKDSKVGVVLENNPEAAYLIYALDILGAKRIGLSIFSNTYKMKRDIEKTKPEYIISTINHFNTLKNPCDALDISPIYYNPVEFDKRIDGVKNLSDIVNIKSQIAEIPYINQENVTDILFTGGSSGIHKGVMLNGLGINEVAKSTSEILKLAPGMTHLGNIPFGHMIFGMFALHYSLANNLTYALTLKSLPQDFLEEIIRTKANGAMGGPVHFDNLHENPLLKKNSLSFLHQTATGGEMLKMRTFNNTMNALKIGGSDAILINMLGLTEMSGLTHACIPGKNQIDTIGEPISCIKDIVVNPALLKNNKIEEVPKGDTGLLLTTGPSMLLGYYDDENETKKVFYEDEYGIKWYNTGDLVKRTGYTPKETKFAGRIKRNFVSGYDNIYPEQIEELLLSIKEIKEAVVTKVPSDKYQFLPVYHLRIEDENINLKELENKIFYLIENTHGTNALPGYISFTTEPLPKTDNNKLNHKLLEERFISKVNEQNEGLKLLRI